MQAIKEKEYAEALAEVRFILKYTNEELVQKIPKVFWNHINDNYDKDYEVHIKLDMPLEEQNLKNDTKNLMAIIYRNYFCTPEEKKEYNDLLIQNQQKYDQELSEKYSYDNLFKNRKNGEQFEQNSVYQGPIEQETIKQNNMQMIEYKENIFKKIFNKIKSFFTRRK